MYRKVSDVPITTKSFITVYEDGRVYFSLRVRENYRLFHNLLAPIKYSRHQNRIYLFPDYPIYPIPLDYTGLKITNAYAKAKRLNMKPGKYVFIGFGNVAAFQRVPD